LQPNSPDDSDISIEEATSKQNGAGRKDDKAVWAFSLWTPIPYKDAKGESKWKWNCNHCRYVPKIINVVNIFKA